MSIDKASIMHQFELQDSMTGPDCGVVDRGSSELDDVAHRWPVDVLNDCEMVKL